MNPEQPKKNTVRVIGLIFAGLLLITIILIMHARNEQIQAEKVTVTENPAIVVAPGVDVHAPRLSKSDVDAAADAVEKEIETTESPDLETTQAPDSGE